MLAALEQQALFIIPQLKWKKKGHSHSDSFQSSEDSTRHTSNEARLALPGYLLTHGLLGQYLPFPCVLIWNTGPQHHFTPIGWEMLARLRGWRGWTAREEGALS